MPDFAQINSDLTLDPNVRSFIVTKLVSSAPMRTRSDIERATTAQVPQTVEVIARILQV